MKTGFSALECWGGVLENKEWAGCCVGRKSDL